jgi:hypothetical protein
MRKEMKVALFAVALAVTALTAVAQAANYSGWSSAQKIDEIAGNSSELNTPFQDGCPIQSPDGLSLYIATTRPRFAGDTRTDLDIWVAKRASVAAPWGAPVNLGEPVNSTADDFCPTPVRGKGLSSSAARRPHPAAGSVTSTSRAATALANGSSPGTSPAPPRAQTAPSMSRDRPTSRRMKRSSTFRGARPASPATSTSAKKVRTAASDRRRRSRS